LDVNNVHIIAAGANGKSLWLIIENNVDLPELFTNAYHTDTIGSKILAHLEVHLCF
jgi:hypothetical protein